MRITNAIIAAAAAGIVSGTTVVVAGCGGSQPTRPQSCYYSADHYASFARIVQ